MRRFYRGKQTLRRPPYPVASRSLGDQTYSRKSERIKKRFTGGVSDDHRC